MAVNNPSANDPLAADTFNFHEHKSKSDLLADAVELMLSLASALQAAHHAGGLTPRYLQQITAWDFLLLLAPNDIRFRYAPKPEPIPNVPPTRPS